MRRVFYRLGRFLGTPFRAAGSASASVHSLLVEDPEDTPLLGVIEKAFNQPTALLEHLDELRRRLMWALLGLAVTTGLSFAFTQRIIDLLAAPIGGIGSLQPIDVTEPISVFMKVALLCGFALGIPWIAFQLWLFIAPGLSVRSRWSTLLSIPLLALFFIGGMAFSYYVLVPSALPYLLNFMGMNTVPRPASYISFVTALLFWVGIAFEFPFVVFILARVGLLPPDLLAKQWRTAMVIIAVAAAAITPTVDPVNMTLLMLPMMALYFLGVILAKVASTSRKKKAVAEG